MLVRDYIRRSLYGSGRGYFNATDCVYSPPKPIRFNELSGHGKYIMELQKLYGARAAAWTTPVELFRPWYSRALGRYILSFFNDESEVCCTNDEKMRIVEIGGGNGTNACHLMDYIKEVAPGLYNRTRYTLVEISAEMAERQRLRCENHSDKVEVINKDFLEWEETIEEPCFIIALEVLDNLPHDKLVKEWDRDKDQGMNHEIPWWIFKSYDLKKWSQTTVNSSRDKKSIESFVEMLQPLTDDLAIRTAELFLATDKSTSTESTNQPSLLVKWARKSLTKARARLEASGNGVFIPTGSLRLLDILSTKFPNHKLIAADFDSLPAPELPLWTKFTRGGEPGSIIGCVNSPLIASKDSSGNTIDHSSYFVQHPGTCDIFFQTDFEKLKAAYEVVIGRPAQAMRSCVFLEKHADHRRTATRSGYNPLLDDYYNTQFLLS